MDLIKDVSTLTTIPEKYLEKLLDKFHYAICDNIVEGVLEGKSLIELNIGIGTLYINILENSVKYKFVPSPKLESNIRDIIIKETNPLELKLESNLVDKITNIYKEYI